MDQWVDTTKRTAVEEATQRAVHLAALELSHPVVAWVGWAEVWEVWVWVVRVVVMISTCSGDWM